MLCIFRTADSFVLKLLIQETQSGVPTWGGSSFRTELSGDNSRVMCPYRDYFNGTYLICCDVVEQVSVVKLIHEHFNFSAYEAYFELGKNDTRKVCLIRCTDTVSSNYSQYVMWTNGLGYSINNDKKRKQIPLNFVYQFGDQYH